MIADLGAPVEVSTEARDNAGDLVPGTAVTLVMTKPDGTPLMPPVTEDASTPGRFTAPLTADQAGTWLLYWASPDPVTLTVSAGQISVSDPHRVLVAGLDEFKAQLDRPDYSDDKELRLYLEAATNHVEYLVGPLTPTTVTERVTGYGSLVLSRYPVLSVTGISAVAGGVVSPVPVPGSGYTHSEMGGIQFSEYAYANEFEITYEVGRTSIPADIKLAGLIIAQHLWSVQNARWTINAPNEDQMQSAPGSSFMVPWRAMELLRPYLSVSNVGGIV